MSSCNKYSIQNRAQSVDASNRENKSHFPFLMGVANRMAVIIWNIWFLCWKSFNMRSWEFMNTSKKNCTATNPAECVCFSLPLWPHAVQSTNNSRSSIQTAVSPIPDTCFTYDSNSALRGSAFARPANKFEQASYRHRSGRDFWCSVAHKNEWSVPSNLTPAVWRGTWHDWCQCVLLPVEQK